MQHRQTQAQLDLFSIPVPAPRIPDDLRQRVLPLIAVLLREAVQQGVGVADYEDHS